MSFFRRTGAEILRILERATDPASVAGAVQLYGKLSGGVTKLFMRDGGGTVAELAKVGGGSAVGDPLTGGTDGSVLYNNSGAVGEDNARLFYDDTNKRLGIGTATPDTALDISSPTTVAAVALRAGSTAAVSAASTGRIRFNESTNKLQFSEHGGAYTDFGSGSGGGGTPAWTAGTYTVGQTVTRGPYVFRANGTTTEDPLIVEGNLGSNVDWTFQTAGTPGTTQTPGAVDGAPNGNILLINNFTGSQATAYRQSVNTGVLGKMLVVDLKITGIADSFYWGMYDSSLAQTFAVPVGLVGFYGAEIDIYDPSTAQIAAISNGARVGTPQSYSNANATNAGSSYSRWYLKTIQNGANWDIEVYRPARIAALFPYTAFNVNQEDDLALIFRQTNVARPSYSTWRFVVGGHTGGSAMIIAVRAAYVRDILSGNWTAIGKIPTQI